MTNEVTVTVDQDLCMGSGYCAKAYPALFALADDGIAYTTIKQLDNQQRTDAEHAATICPASAIELHEGTNS